MLPAHPRLAELARLALPAIAVQVGMMLMGVVDTLMAGHLSAAALASVALGNLYFFAPAITGMGTLMALDPVIAQAVGAGDRNGIARGLQRGLVLALVLTIPASLALLPAQPIFEALHQPADVVPSAAQYALAVIPGVFPFFAFVVLRQTLQALERMTPIVIVIVLANLVNLLLDWALIFGHFGVPALGVVGAAWATTVSRWFMALGLMAASWGVLGPLLRESHPEVARMAPLARMLRLGLPIGAQYFLEYGAFGLTALLMGLLGMEQMAGHQIALNLASLTFMVPLGVSAAAAVLVGQAVGRGDMMAARESAWLALGTGAAFMSCTAAVFLLVPGFLASLYTADPAVLTVGALLIPIAGIFQVFDGLQAVGGGVLRGMGDTRAPMLINILGFWLIGIPVGAYLGLRTSLGPQGLWWGLVAGLAAVATFLLLRIRIGLKREVKRVMIDTTEHRIMTVGVMAPVAPMEFEAEGVDGRVD